MNEGLEGDAERLGRLVPAVTGWALSLGCFLAFGLGLAATGSLIDSAIDRRRLRDLIAEEGGAPVASERVAGEEVNSCCFEPKPTTFRQPKISTRR